MPAPELDLSKAIDLSGLRSVRQIPEGAFECKVDGGCNLVVRGREHADLQDCLHTSLPYVGMYMEAEEVAVQLAERYQHLEALAVQLQRDNDALAAMYRDLLIQKDRQAADLRRLRKGTPEATAALLEAGAALVQAVSQTDENAEVTH